MARIKLINERADQWTRCSWPGANDRLSCPTPKRQGKNCDEQLTIRTRFTMISIPQSSA